jgi:hypothetical protein
MIKAELTKAQRQEPGERSLKSLRQRQGKEGKVEYFCRKEANASLSPFSRQLLGSDVT